MRLVIMGPPGAGKGTQSALISSKYGIPHVSTGDMFREILKRSDGLANRIRKYVESGELVPDELVVEMVRDRICRPDCEGGFILDGFPRTVAQAEALDRMLESAGKELNAVLYLRVSEEAVVRRLSRRRVCESCGAIYHLDYNPPKRPGVCDRCGGRLIQRDDDREEVIRERLRVYHEQTEPLINYYREKGLLVEIDGCKEIHQVWEDVQRVLDPIASRGDC
ncbi:MAG: adenylate kinase [Candidatus Korarchaeota archaeon]|nr:adenylate kinase [Candidatus Korarchaeota archaeon]